MAKSFLDGFFNLRDKIILVTGATGQLGFEICNSYVKTGAKIIGTDKELNSSKMVKSDNIKYFEMDITDKKSIANIFERVNSSYGRFDILVNNAGVSAFEPFEDRPESSFDWVMDVNLKGTFLCIQTYINGAKRKEQNGNIINIGSIYGVVSPDYRIYSDCARRNSEVYGATKAGIIQMTKYFAVHAAKYGIRVNCVSPGGIFNPENPQGKDFIKNYSDRCPMGRLASAEEIIGGILYLSSDAARYVTGQNLVIDGGMSCW